MSRVSFNTLIFPKFSGLSTQLACFYGNLRVKSPSHHLAMGNKVHQWISRFQSSQWTHMLMVCPLLKQGVGLPHMLADIVLFSLLG